jgi:hypothetical protein
MRSAWFHLLCIGSVMNAPAFGEEAAAAIGKKLAADSGIHWHVREADHPLLGPIQYAVLQNEVATSVRNQKIFSNAYVSCQRKSGTLAIELTSAPASDLAGGLGPADLPRLVCNKPGPTGGLVKSDLDASWEISTLGDTLARGLSPSALRQCASIDVLQNLALPRGWPLETQRIAMQIAPYSRELDAVFVRCGETTAFVEAEPPRPVAAAPARPATAQAPPAPPAPRIEQKASPAELPWRAARTIASGRTNIRAGPNLASPVVIQLDPGAPVLVQQTPGEWWKVRPANGAGFSGYIRSDRLQLERQR